MKRVIVAAAMMAALAAPAFAQFSGSQDGQKTPLQLQYEREERDQRDNEKAYNDQMRRLKAQKPTAKSDPWAGVRPDETGNTKR